MLIRDELSRQSGVVSYQVVQEFLNIAVRKFAALMTSSEADLYMRRTLEPLLKVGFSVNMCSEALKLEARYRLSWYDSLIVAAALEANCETLYTEDMQHGHKIDRLMIVNPFI